jgi:nicotinamide mononucleotide (NMN) deamidase PncC
LGRNLAYLVFASLFAKNKCAKLGIAITGFSNPKKGEENKKLKTVSISLNCFYETLFCALKCSEKNIAVNRIIFYGDFKVHCW